MKAKTRLRQMLREPGIIVAPGAYDCLTAKIVAREGFPAVYMTGGGYGGVLNVRRTVREYERAGVAAIHIEDQEYPKRCGHLDDKRVISGDEMALKIRAAVDARKDDDFAIIVRTDALAVTGMDDTMARCEKYVEAGADVLFIEALRTRDEVERVTRAFDVPLLFNFAEKVNHP